MNREPAKAELVEKKGCWQILRLPNLRRNSLAKKQLLLFNPHVFHVFQRHHVIRCELWWLESTMGLLTSYLSILMINLIKLPLMEAQAATLNSHKCKSQFPATKRNLGRGFGFEPIGMKFWWGFHITWETQYALVP